MHPNQLRVPVQTVRILIDEQFPDWRAEPITPVRSHGTVNALFRIGDRLTARFPLEHRDPDAARRWLEDEHRAAA